MAEIKKKYFGDLKGKFGDAVFRTRGNKNFIARKGKYSKPDTDEFRSRTDTFKMSSRLASLINANKYLKLIWQNKLGKTSLVYPNLIKKNYSSFSGTVITGSPSLVPENGIGVKFESLLIDDNNVTLKLKPLTASSTIDTAVEKKILSALFIFLSNPLQPTSNPAQIISLISSKLSFTLEDEITFIIPLSTADSDLIKYYSGKTFLSTVITFDENDNVVNYAKTFSPTPA